MPRYDLHFESLSAEEQGFSSKIFTMDTPAFGVFGTKGPQWLINMWLKILFTRQGSDPTNLSRGTSFTNLIGSTVSPSDAEDIVRLCVDEASNQLRAIQQNDTELTARERLASAKLIRYVEDNEGPGFKAYVEILNEAGERLKVNIPAYSRG
jgi:hypothetical protein